MMAARIGLGDVVKSLRKHYGAPQIPEPRDPFGIILWENAAYLVDDARRAQVYGSLEKDVGLAPAQLLAAGSRRIAAAIREGGMQPSHRAEKVLRCAEIAVSYADGELAAALQGMPLSKARALLKRFPGVGDPGADKILLLCGYASLPALESNGLRVLERLGFVVQDDAYARMYRAAVRSLQDAQVDFVDAFALLRQHGRELCKRTAPFCQACPLRAKCAYARSR